MPTWTTHTEGGSWHGGGTEVPDCGDAEQQAIIDAYNSFIGDSCLDCFPGLEECLREEWDSIEIDCTSDACDDGLHGQWNGSRILICCTNVGCSKSSTRLDAVLLHELVHACDGTELDAEAVEWMCFQGNGASSPSGEDWEKFRNNEGNYVIWDEDTGEVWEKVDGSKGDKCFQHPQWEHSFGDDGGGW